MRRDAVVRVMLRALFAPYIRGAQVLFQVAINDTRQKHPNEVRYQGITLTGEERGIAFFRRALEILEARDVRGFSLVRRYVNRLVFSERKLKRAFIAKSLFCTEETLEQFEVERFASVLARQAVFIRLMWGFRITAVVFYSKRCRRVAYRREYRSMQALNCADWYLEQQSDLIERVS